MRREIHWYEEGKEGQVGYEVRVRFFGKKFRFQFREDGSTEWDYDREPQLVDVERLVEVIERYYPRGRATYKELMIARGLLCEYRGKAL